MVDRRLSRSLKTPPDARNDATCDPRWREVEAALSRELRRGAMSLAEAEACFQEAPEEELSESTIRRLVAEATRRAREASETCTHWHFWIGAASRSHHGELTLHVAGVLSGKSAVAAVCKTVQTPNWAIVSVNSLECGVAHVVPPAADGAGFEGVDISAVCDSIECAGESAEYWQFSTDVSLKEASVPECYPADPSGGKGESHGQP